MSKIPLSLKDCSDEQLEYLMLDDPIHFGHTLDPYPGVRLLLALYKRLQGELEKWSKGE